MEVKLPFLSSEGQFIDFMSICKAIAIQPGWVVSSNSELFSIKDHDSGKVYPLFFLSKQEIDDWISKAKKVIPPDDFCTFKPMSTSLLTVINMPLSKHVGGICIYLNDKISCFIYQQDFILCTAQIQFIYELWKNSKP